jgi:hypothetical protein
MGVNLGQLVAKIAGMVAVLSLSLFLSAGTLAWPAGWAFLLLFLGFVVALSFIRHSFAKAGIENSFKILDSGSRFACPE